ncbi:MAG: UDP-glycosyltransferase [Flavobacterium sp.]|nr:UDP-glycosyltransferase [Flavobacterium sp.]
MITDSIDIEDSSGSKANVALIANLRKAGFEITVYHYTRKNILLDGINCYSIPEIKFSLNYFISRAQRILQRKFKIELAPFFEKRFGFSFTFFNDTNSIKKALQQSNLAVDLVLTLSKGGSFRPHYAVLQIPEWHSKWIAYIHDPYPFHYYPRPYNWVEPAYKFKEDFFVKLSEKAKYSAFPSQLLKEWMGSYFPNFLKTGIIIPHQNAAYSIKNNQFLDYFDASKFNLLHAGNLMKQRNPKALIDGYLLFLQQNPEAIAESCLLLIGPASDHAKLLSNYKNTPELYIANQNIPFDVIYNLQQNTAVNVILEAKSEISPFLPAKFPHCVEANKPILLLSPYYSETRRLLGDDYPFWTEADDVDKIAIAIGRLYEIWKKNPNALQLNRSDLLHYLSASYLKIAIESL